MEKRGEVIIHRKALDSVPVSVIIPSYNTEKYIAKCLNSVISQSIPVEVILVDNDSSDKTLELSISILQKSEKDFIVLKNYSRGNVSLSRNLGIEYARGEYIYFLDSDDFLTHTDALKIAYEKAKDEQLDIVHFGFNRVTEKGRVILPYALLYGYVQNLTDGINALKMFLKGRIWFCIGNTIYRKDFIKTNNIKFTENCYVGEDQEFIIKALSHSEKVNSVRKTFVGYVIRKNSLSKISTDLFKAVETFERVKCYLKSNGMDEIIPMIDDYKIPYLIVRAFFKATRNTKFDAIERIFDDNPKYFDYLKKAKFGFDFYSIPTFIFSKLILTFPKFSYYFAKLTSIFLQIA
jgi:glycosyltransferase involved in cell wall biosynthesis